MPKEVSAKQFFDEIVEKYEEAFMEDSRYFDTIDRFCLFLGEGSKTVLELGCGPGNLTKYIDENYSEISILATDISPKMLEAASKNVSNARLQQLDLKDIHSLDMTFDGILCGFGLPYLSRDAVGSFIVDAVTKLNTGGILYISTMEDDDIKSGLKSSSSKPDIGVHLYYHQGAYILSAMKNAGLGILMEERRTYHESNGDETTDLFVIGRKLN